MPKVPWVDLACHPRRAHLLVAELDPSFFGGRIADDPFDSQRLREGVNLVSRVCTRLKLRSRYSATTSRVGCGSVVLCAFESDKDRDRVADLVAARASIGSDCEWGSRRTFGLNSATHERLVTVGGETDNRYAGRRRRDRERSAAEQTLRWGDV
ncbi:hypothetical protein [Reyranella sp.]|uniref:hypothetical protein n=1 Tax=Reyranella sp. TaxID=1929291 RepID=UPI003D127A54